MKNILLAIVLLASGSAFADMNVSCVDQKAQDPQFSASFKLTQNSAKVDLFILSGETSGSTVSGECRSDDGAIELSITCSIMTSSDSGYEVRLFSIGGPSLHATITPWSMAGKFKTTVLSCVNSIF